MRQKAIPIAAVAVGILAFLLTYQYLRNKEKELERLRAEIYAGAAQISVVAAAREVPSGTTLGQEDLGRKRIYKSTAPERVISVDDAAMIVGRKTAWPIKRGDPILWSDIEGGERRDLTLSSSVKHGMRAISLSIGGASAVSGMVRPNDRIDVLGTFSFPSKRVPGEMETVTLTVLQDVTVLATGQEMARAISGGARRSSGYNTVTLEVTPREAELLTFAQHTKGALALSLRNPSDVSFESDLPETDFEHLENKLPELNLYRQRHIRHKTDL